MHHLLRIQIKLLGLVIGLMVTISCFAQPQDMEMYRPDHAKEPYYFGITLGYNSTFLHPTKSAYFLQHDSVQVGEPGASGGITLGFLGTARINDHLQLRINPQLVIGGAKYFKYTLNKDSLALDESVNVKKTLPATLISLPVQIKFNSDRIDNFQFYVLGGVRFDKDITSNSSARNAEGLIKLKGNDFALETGLGFEFFLPFVTISPEIKFSYGLANIHARDENLKYSAIFDKIQSRMISFSLHFGY